MLRHALLALLCREALTGYELTKRFYAPSHAERLATYRELQRTLTRQHGGIEITEHGSLVGPYLCLQQGLWHEQMYVRWCRWAVARLAARRRRRRARRTGAPSTSMPS